MFNNNKSSSLTGVFLVVFYSKSLTFEICANKFNPLADDKGKVVDKLKGAKSGNDIEIKKEGIHFDLEHRNRISWTEDDLEGFKEALKRRIQAVVL